MHPLTWFMVSYIAIVMIALGIFWVYYDRRDKEQFDARRKRKVFHCVRCNSLYSIRKRNVEEGEACPECGYNNHELSF